MEPLKLHVTPELSETKGGRRPTEVSDNGSTKPDPEVTPRATRRYLTVAYKLKVLETVAALREQEHGAVGAYLRKEGLYYSSISFWEKLRDQGLLTKSKKGPREKNHDALLAENKQLRRKLQQAEKRLAKTELIVELQKKLSAIMDLDEPNPTVRSDAE
jgi:transposase